MLLVHNPITDADCSQTSLSSRFLFFFLYKESSFSTEKKKKAVLEVINSINKSCCTLSAYDKIGSLFYDKIYETEV